MWGFAASSELGAAPRLSPPPTPSGRDGDREIRRQLMPMVVPRTHAHLAPRRHPSTIAFHGRSPVFPLRSAASAGGRERHCHVRVLRHDVQPRASCRRAHRRARGRAPGRARLERRSLDPRLPALRRVDAESRRRRAAPLAVPRLRRRVGPDRRHGSPPSPQQRRPPSRHRTRRDARARPSAARTPRVPGMQGADGDRSG